MASLPERRLQLEGSSRRNEQHLRVLLVDDNLVQQKLVTLLLKQLGHTVRVASDGFEALSAVQLDSDYDVVLMDCQMPLMDGIQATRFIREAERITGQSLAIIGISAAASPEECFGAGMNDFLSKPLSKLALKAVLERWVTQKGA